MVTLGIRAWFGTSASMPLAVHHTWMEWELLA
jgi:hypothetical protein